MTPRIFITCTRCSSGIMAGAEKFAFRLLSTKIISRLFAKLSLSRYKPPKKFVILQISVEREPMLTAGIIMYVSSAYLQSSLPSVVACRSDVFTTKDSGPIAELVRCVVVFVLMTVKLIRSRLLIRHLEMCCCI